MYMITLKNITYKVQEEKTGVSKTIIDDLSFAFEPNKITVITGQNGSGKSTLISLLMGLIQPNSGKILYQGKDITNLSVTDRAKRGITIAFQQPVRFKGLTVKQLLDIATGTTLKVTDACHYLSVVGLCAREYIDRALDDTLSGGELKRIELAMALAKGGEVFLFDEPEAGIDLWSFEELIQVFKKLNNKTVIIVSHQNKILSIADQIVLMDNGVCQVVEKDHWNTTLLNKKCGRLSEVIGE